LIWRNAFSTDAVDRQYEAHCLNAPTIDHLGHEIGKRA
jgi:hypothetical protein